MASGRKRRAAFTLTEVLMAAGILGIGLTMVASIFPVAVDQSRRSRDQTMAALCARSVAAGMRIQRNGASAFMRDKKFGFEIPDYALPPAMRLYKPNVFLKSRTYSGVSTWDGGNLVARVWLFPVNFDGRGPWRATILVCKAQGTAPPANVQTEWRYMVLKDKMYPGSYVYEYRWQGYGYMLDYIAANTGYLSVGAQATGAAGTIPFDAQTWYCCPEAIAVYYTILGS